MKRQPGTADLAFIDYCRGNDIKPLNQDQVIQSPVSSKKTIIQNLGMDNKYTPEILIYNNSKDEYFVDGQKNIIKSLRLGKYKIIASIDLHNNTQATALARVENFIENHTTPGNACLKIIHGKGLNSHGNEGVLKHIVRRYLEQYEHILAYSKPGLNAGGDGVTLVKLKN